VSRYRYKPNNILLPGLFLLRELELTTKVMVERFKSPYDWRFMVVGGEPDSKHRGFFFCKIFIKKYI
jgi:hypothetical protein